MRSLSSPAALATAALCMAAICTNGAGSAAQQTSTSGRKDLLTPPLDKPIRGMTWPALSPDGSKLCFSYRGNLWTVSSSGGVATRLTDSVDWDGSPHWSPDGKWIAFTSLRSGNADIFLVPSDGGAARQVTINSSNDWINDWSPDGNSLLFYGIRETRNFALFTINLHTRTLDRLNNDDQPQRFAAYSPNGRYVAYCRSGQPWWRPWYRGSVASSVTLEDMATRKLRTLAVSSAQQFWPLWSPDGQSLLITTIEGRGDTPNIWRFSVTGGSPRQITHYTDDAVRFPTIARKGNLLAYIRNGVICTTHLDGSDPHGIDIIVRTDDKTANQRSETLTHDVQESELSPDGKSLALVLRGNIWLMPVTGGGPVRLTNDVSIDNDINWSPDSSKIVMISDRAAEVDVYTLDVKSRAVTRMTSDGASKSNPTYSPDGKYISFACAGAEPGLYVIPSAGGAERLLASGDGNNDFLTGINSHSWSPDSRWVALSRMDKYDSQDVWVVPAAGGTLVNVTKYPGSNIEPQFTKDGRRLLFLSDRNGLPALFQIPLLTPDDVSSPGQSSPDHSKDVEIDFQDIERRAVQVNPPAGPVDDYGSTPDGRRAIVHMGDNFWSLPLTPGGAQQLTSAGEPGGAIRITPDGSRFFYIGANGTPRTLATTGGPISIVPLSADYVFDQRVQYLRAFNEFYRKYGADFYDARMNGVKWSALRDKYEPLLEGVGTPWDFASLLSEMVGEVNSSHSEVAPADGLTGPRTAWLGVYPDYTYTGPGIHVASVLRDGPADRVRPKIVAGDYILQVDGTPVSMNEDFYQALQDKAGKTVKLLVNRKPVMAGARTAEVKPITPAVWLDLHYAASVRHDRDLVDKLSAGKVAYIRLRAMDAPSVRSFERELWDADQDKEGLVLDVRRNGGGFIPDQILDALGRHIYGYTQPRDGVRAPQPYHLWDKPIVLLVDQDSASAAELFPSAFRALRLGKIIGTPTPGYVLGTHDATLLDGTHYRLPSWGFYTVDGKNLEGRGVRPDVIVNITPEEAQEHLDPQLAAAVKTVLAELPTRGQAVAARR